MTGPLGSHKQIRLTVDSDLYNTRVYSASYYGIFATGDAFR